MTSARAPLLALAAALALALPAVLALPGAPVAGPAPETLPDALRVPASSHGHDHGEHPEGAGGHDAAGAHDAHATAPAPAGADEEGGHAHARHRTAWPPAEGKIPSSGEGLVEVRALEIRYELDREEREALGGALSGNGTLEDPYVIEGVRVTRELELRDTHEHFVVRNSFVEGTLRLNWNDDRVHVHHNWIRDLRVNENVERTGEATGGLIEQNRFGIVGQIRHFDGVFRDNVVGPAPRGAFDALIEDSGEVVPVFGERRALNVDGFHGGIFERNEIHGYVEMQLHGHHHGSCFDCHSHNHGDAERAALHDHAIRYHEVDFRDNVVAVERGVAFRYTDAAHAGDDRTATSETEETLGDPHVHFTRVAIERNAFAGGPLVVEIFNADDRRHANEETDAVEPVAAHEGHAYRGDLVVRDNVVAYALRQGIAGDGWFGAVHAGILVRDAKEARVLLSGNEVTMLDAERENPLSGAPFFGEGLGGAPPSALELRDLRAARLLVEGNLLSGARVGILARAWGPDAAWTLGANTFEDVTREVDADETVRAAP